MRLPRIFEYRNEKGGIVADLQLHSLFHLLRSLAPIVPRRKLGRTNISHPRLELVGDDGSYYDLVLVEFKMD